MLGGSDSRSAQKTNYLRPPEHRCRVRVGPAVWVFWSARGCQHGRGGGGGGRLEYRSRRRCCVLECCVTAVSVFSVLVVGVGPCCDGLKASGPIPAAWFSAKVAVTICSLFLADLFGSDRFGTPFKRALYVNIHASSSPVRCPGDCHRVCLVHFNRSPNFYGRQPAGLPLISLIPTFRSSHITNSRLQPPRLRRQIITTGGVTYKQQPWHRECFTCTNCNASLAGQRFTSRDEKPYCADCFGELFAKRCTACSKPITGTAMWRLTGWRVSACRHSQCP